MLKLNLENEDFEESVKAELREKGFKYILIEGCPMLLEDWIGSARWKIQMRELEESIDAEADS